MAWNAELDATVIAYDAYSLSVSGLCLSMGSGMDGGGFECSGDVDKSVNGISSNISITLIVGGRF